jgi:nucleoside-diphosphate-sugar epimerase
VYGCDLVDYPSQEYHYTKLSRLNPDYQEVFLSNTYDYCINAAGNGSVPVSIEKPLLDFDANCYDVIRILQLIKEKNPGCKYLHFSSAAVYGNPSTLPIREQDNLAPVSPYGWHKLIAEKICEEYSQLYNICCSVVRPFSVYGPGLRKQLIWDMYMKTKKSKSVELWGDGTESRDFIYIDDLVDSIELILRTQQETRFGIYNLASGEETTIQDVARIFYNALDPDVVYTFNGNARPGDPKNWKADIGKLLGAGFTPRYTLESGLKNTAEWIKKLG